MNLNIPKKGTKPKLLPIHVYFKENLKRFLIETSLNGLKYIQDGQRNIYERSSYLISFTIVFTSGLYMSIYFLQKWQSTPVLISMSSKTTSIQDIPFPAITFCNMNQALHSKVSKFKRHSPDYAMLQKLCFQDYNYSRFQNFKPRFVGDTFGNFIEKNTQSCSDMIIYCKFGPNEETCSDLFRDVLLDEGQCCVFNQLHPFFLYKGDYKFIRDLTSSNGRTSIPINWNMEQGYENQNLRKSYYPRKAAGSGVSMGLTVVLNADLDDYYCSSTNGPGFKVLLYNPIDSPHIKETGLPVILGHQSRVRINAKQMKSTPSLRTINHKARQCYFSTEKTLLYFKYYTRRNCEMECDSKLLLRLCNCIPYHMPLIYANASICFLSEMNCVVAAESIVFDYQNYKCKEDCLSGCHDLWFYPSIFVTPLAQKEYALQDIFFRNKTKGEMYVDLAVVQFYFKENSFRGNTKVPYTGFTEFLSQTGGVMSLMVGFSVVSIAEVLYFVLFKSFIDMFLKRSPKEVHINQAAVDEKEVKDMDRFHHQMLFKRRKPIHNRVMHWDTNELKKYKRERY